MVNIPLEITLRDLSNSAAVEERIRKKVDKLGVFYDHIECCKVVVEMPQKHKHQGKLFNVLVELNVPGKRLVANHKESEDIYIAMRDTFAAIRRQLEEYAHRQRGNVKAHMLNGHIESEEERE